MRRKAEEKRVFTRLDVGADVRYRITGEEKYNEALLDNVSAGGILFWSRRELMTGTQVYLTIDPVQTERSPIQIKATVIGIRPLREDGRFGYGCRIDVTKNAEDSLTYHSS